MWRCIGLHSFIFLSLLLASCATGGEIVKPAGVSHTVPDVPFYPQEAYKCGPASLAGVLNYWGVRVEPGEISKEIFSKSARGTLNVDMALYAQKKGLYALQYKGAMKDLRKKIDARQPVIVLVDFGFWVYELDHFMVVTGY